MCQDDVKIWNTRGNLNNILLVLEITIVLQNYSLCIQKYFYLHDAYMFTTIQVINQQHHYLFMFTRTFFKAFLFILESIWISFMIKNKYKICIEFDCPTMKLVSLV